MALEGIKSPIVFAHQGASRECPGNTLAAFDRARALGAALEMDVRATSDNVVVVIHDDFVNNTTDGHGSVSTMPITELERLDAGYQHRGANGERGWAGRGLRIPRLQNVLARYPNTIINIDVKQVSPCIVGLVADLIREAHVKHLAAGHCGPLPIILTLFSGKVKHKLEGEQLPCSYGLSKPEVLEVLARSYLRWVLPGPLKGRVAMPERLHGRALQIPCTIGLWGRQLPVFSKAVREAVAGAHMPAHVWEVDEPSEAARWLAAGVDGVFSNDPAALFASSSLWKKV